MSEEGAVGPGEPGEAELRAAWEEQLRRLTPADVIVQAVVSLISLAGRRLGVEPGTEPERDLEQVRDAIDGARGLMPVLERREGKQRTRRERAVEHRAGRTHEGHHDPVVGQKFTQRSSSP